MGVLLREREDEATGERMDAAPHNGSDREARP
jgi:hypothetical protein